VVRDVARRVANGCVIVAAVSHESSPYDRAPALEQESAWLDDGARVYRAVPRLRGSGRDSAEREYALRAAAVADRIALADPRPAAREAAEAAAERLWIADGWDENWEGGSPRAYVRWAYGQWLTPGSREGDAG
jgi:hypothetical protein